MTTTESKKKSHNYLYTAMFGNDLKIIFKNSYKQQNKQEWKTQNHEANVYKKNYL